MILKKIYKRLISEKRRLKIRDVLTRSTYPLYLGNTFICNCCNKKFRKFLPKGNIPRKNAKCPYCFSLERSRTLWLFLQNEKILNGPPISILHFAPEECLFNNIVKMHHHYVDGDINPALARNVIDITSIPFSNDYFDLIICSHVLGHVPNEAKALNEMRRVLKPEGMALILTLINPDATTYENENVITPLDKLIHYGENDLCRLHGIDFDTRLKNAGFKVETIDVKTFAEKSTIEKLSLGNGERELIFKCKK